MHVETIFRIVIMTDKINTVKKQSKHKIKAILELTTLANLCKDRLLLGLIY